MLCGATQTNNWQQKCLSAQGGLSTAQAEAARLQKQAAASAAAAEGRGQLLEQLQAAGAALADSHASCHKLLRELNELRAAHKHTQQELTGGQSLHPMHLSQAHVMYIM